ncbi:metal-sensing transcriptional repressor [Alkaliphilus transvaalensis]|uniref:metal-sensing transcriptional repressor n=1 Tax=Alkaliphilus transvaalensis TaxID=114628 RepID=UPI00047D77D0|nr:metal-sensing transcriptional repressor [Alkaliphilus transvaalensis]
MKLKKLIKQSLKIKEGIMYGLNKMKSFLLEKKKPTVLSREDKEIITNRLSEMQRQIDDIKFMIESDDHYFDIIKQIEYSRRVLNAAEILLLESHSVPLQ